MGSGFPQGREERRMSLLGNSDLWGRPVSLSTMHPNPTVAPWALQSPTVHSKEVRADLRGCGEHSERMWKRILAPVVGEGGED